MTISHNDLQNLVILTGHLVADADTRLVNDTFLTTFKIATNERYKTRSGDWESKATYHDIQAWGKLAEKATDLQKGDKVQIWGKLVSNQKSEGRNGKTYYNSYVKAEVITPFSH